MRGSVGAGGGGSRRLPGAPHTIAGSHPRRDVPPRRDRPRPTWRSIPVQVRRAYYHCADCGHGVVPRDDELGVAGSSLSPGLATMVDRAGAAAPFAKASSLLGDLAGIALTTKRVERAAEADGAAAAAATQAHAGAILSRRVVPLPPAPLPDKLYIAVDGTGVPMVPAETAGRAGKAAAGRARPTPARPNSPACSPRPAWTPTADPCATPAPPPTWPPSPPSNSSPRWCTPRPGAADQNGSSLDRVDLDP